MTDRIDFSKTNNPLPWRDLLTVGFSLLGPAGAWALHLNLTYFLVQPVCVMGGEILLHVSGFVTLLIALSAVATSIRLLVANPVPFGENVEGFDGWKAFVGLFGFAIGALFTLAIITQWTPVFVINACTKVWS